MGARRHHRPELQTRLADFDGIIAELGPVFPKDAARPEKLDPPAGTSFGLPGLRLLLGHVDEGE